MNEHIHPVMQDALRGFIPPEMEIDHLAREEALRERHHERRMMAHPDPRDPDHPED